MEWMLRKSIWTVVIFMALVLIFKDYSKPESVVLAAEPVASSVIAKSEATQIVRSGKDLEAFVRYNKVKKDNKAQSRGMEIYIKILVKDDKKITTNEKYAMNNFIIYGTPSSKIFISDQRFLMIKKFKEFHGHLPKTENDWKTLLIANGIN